MTLTKQEQFYVITDAIGPALFTLYICMSRYRRNITHSMFLTFWFGVFIGSLWEIPFGLAGDSFLVAKFYSLMNIYMGGIIVNFFFIKFKFFF